MSSHTLEGKKKDTEWCEAAGVHSAFDITGSSVPDWDI